MKTENEHNYYQKFDNWEIQHISYHFINEDRSFITVNCQNYTDELKMSYMLKLFLIEAIDGERFDVRFLDQTQASHPLTQSSFVQDLKDKELFYWNFLSFKKKHDDSILFLNEVRWSFDEILKYDWVIEDSYSRISGNSIGFNQFYAQSYFELFNSTYLVWSVDNFGVIVVSLITKKVVAQLQLTEIDPRLFTEYIEIKSVYQFRQNGFKILTKDLGSVTLKWDYMEPDGKGGLFHGVSVWNWVIPFKDEILTNLISTTPIGYVHVVYYMINDRFYEAYFKVYNFFNKQQSKILYEKRIGKVTSWSSIHSNSFQNEKMVRVIVIWDSMIYAYYLNMYPYISITEIDTGDNFDFTLQAYNENSLKSITVKVVKEMKPADMYNQIWLIVILIVLIGFPIWLIKLISIIWRNIEMKRIKSENLSRRTISYELLKKRIRLELEERSETIPLMKHQSLIVESNNEYFSEVSEER